MRWRTLIASICASYSHFFSQHFQVGLWVKTYCRSFSTYCRMVHQGLSRPRSLSQPPRSAKPEGCPGNGAEKEPLGERGVNHRQVQLKSQSLCVLVLYFMSFTKTVVPTRLVPLLNSQFVCFVFLALRFFCLIGRGGTKITRHQGRRKISRNGRFFRWHMCQVITGELGAAQLGFGLKLARDWKQLLVLISWPNSRDFLLSAACFASHLCLHSFPTCVRVRNAKVGLYSDVLLLHLLEWHWISVDVGCPNRCVVFHFRCRGPQLSEI